MKKIEQFKENIRSRNALKVISGIDNFDLERIKKVVSAADQAGASAIDICFDRAAYELTREISDLPVFVSSVKPEELAQAVLWGADAIELGNFDALYKKGERFGSDEVYSLVEKTLELIGEKGVYICVTIPGHIEVNEQIALAQKLELLGIDLIQTEGAATVCAQSAGARGLLETAQVSIANTIELSRNASIPIMCASGMTDVSAPLAYAAGASAVGVGSCINKLGSVIEMIASIRNLQEKIGLVKRESVEV